MNVRDPFSLRRSNALNILQGTARQTALNLKQRALQTGAQAIESGRLAIESGRQAVEDMSFTDPQRELENRGAWASSGVTARNNGYGYNGMQEKVGGFFEKQADLPMYKDKPFSYPTSRRHRPWWKKRRLLASVGLFIMFVLYCLGFIGGSTTKKDKKESNLKWLKGTGKSQAIDWLDRRDSVVEAFTLSWDAYERYAWGYDEFYPLTKTGKQMTPKGMGWIIVDALDTMMLMNLTSRITKARSWITTKLDYDQDQEVNTFETTIRMLGGLLSAHYLSTTFPEMAPISEDDEGTAGEDLYIDKAKDLADRIMGAFDSPSGIPYASFNLKTLKGVLSHDDGGASSTAEAATLQLELKYLSKLTGENYYWEKAERVMQIIDDNAMEDGLLPIYIYAGTGKFRGNNIRLGSRGDSYYEYLIKQYLQTSKQEPVYKEMWDQALSGVRKHLITYSKHAQFTVLGERQNGLNDALTPKMDHLVCFMGGTIALGATNGISEAEARKMPWWTSRKDDEMRLARELTQTCWGMYKATKTGLAGEITHFVLESPPPPESAPHHAPKTFDPSEDANWRKDFIVKSNDNHNLQRPETAESLFYMWRITGDEIYREWGWEMFQSFIQHTAVEGSGFTSLSHADVLPAIQKNNMESFWLAETLKYFYLLFSPNDLLPLDQVVINTEAHPLPVFDMGSLFKTGWTRKPRGADGKLLPEPGKVGHQAVEAKADVKRL